MTFAQRIFLFALLVAAFALSLGGRGVRAQAPAEPRAPDSPRSLAAQAAAQAQISQARTAFELTTRLDLDLAAKELEGADLEVPEIAAAKARLAVFTGDCDLAATLLARRELQADDNARSLADLARGCARVTAGVVVLTDAARGVEVKFQDEHDAALFPLLVDTIDRARAMLTAELGVDWPRPTRFVVVRDHLSLSAMTGLPYEAARTTGTVAVAKWGKVTLLTPRAARHGYPWRDTVAHELTHLAITRASADRAPLWLQEGLAKRQEVRWRTPSSFDDRPPADAIVVRGIARKLDLPLDKLGPSIAMLPSAEAAQVAFSEVTSFVRYFASRGEKDTLPKLLLALKNGQSVDDALKFVTQKDLTAWDAEWRAQLPKSATPPAGSTRGPSALRPGASPRDRVRLAELLLAQGHAEAAAAELEGLERAEGLGDDPGLRALRGRVLEALERRDQAAPLVLEPRDVASSFAPWWALRGRVLGAKGDEPGAEASFAEGIGEDPFDRELACRTKDGAASRADAGVNPGVNAGDPACNAARSAPPGDSAD